MTTKTQTTYIDPGILTEPSLKRRANRLGYRWGHVPVNSRRLMESGFRFIMRGPRGTMYARRFDDAAYLLNFAEQYHERPPLGAV